MSGDPHAALRAVLAFAEAGYFADFEVIDQSTAAGVAGKDARDALAFAVDLGLVDQDGPIRLTPYGREVFYSASRLDDLAARIKRPAAQTRVLDERVELPATHSEWREFQQLNIAAAAAVARGLIVSTAEIFFRVRPGSEHVFESRFLRRLGKPADPAFVRAGAPVMARVVDGYVRWVGWGDIVGLLLGLDVVREGDAWLASGELAWQLAEEGWRPGPPQPVREIEEGLDRLSPWFRAGLELAEFG